MLKILFKVIAKTMKEKEPDEPYHNGVAQMREREISRKEKSNSILEKKACKGTFSRIQRRRRRQREAAVLRKTSEPQQKSVGGSTQAENILLLV